MMKLMHRRKLNIKSTLLALALFLASLVGLSLTTGTAQASSISYVWNDYASSVSLYGVPYYASVIQYSRNGTRFQMVCYTDNAGQRWAWGQIFDTGRTLYVPMWEVGAQISVRHC